MAQVAEVQETGRAPRVKTLPEQRAAWDWSSVPEASSPKGFAKLPYPWQKTKEGALEAHRAMASKDLAAKDLAAKGKKPKAKATGAAPLVKAAVDAGALKATLTDLADRYGLDMGSRKHRTAELYQMLLHPFRDRPVTLLEIGPCLGVSEERAPADRPKLRMWLEFFAQARIHGLDAGDFAGVRQDRFSFHRGDLGDRGSIAAACARMPDFDIIIDDASHASHHQQNGFLELFPRLKPGGLYILEGLRGQPEGLERPGITKTAELFRSFSESRRFRHGDAGVEAAFNALGDAISGCFLFQVGYDRKRRDQVAVIHKR